MPEPSSHAARRYVGFLSYRHADNKEEGRRWAEWLHHALETYEIPADLVGTPNLRGNSIPSSLYPVFRDEEELPADADLSDNICLALENSEALIVLCSPRACGSRFVAEEIRIFKELGKGDRILALILDGEPNVTDDAAKRAQFGVESECLPEPLRRGVRLPSGMIDWNAPTEPIAADARPGGRPEQGYTSASAYRTALEKEDRFPGPDQRREARDYAERLDLARLKVTAGLLGLPLGVLRKRDAVHRARRLRRLATAFGLLAVLALAGGGVAWWQKGRADVERASALAAQGRAIASRNQAESILQYLLGSLRSKLSSKAGISILQDVEHQVDDYYQKLGVDPSDASQLSSRARAHLNQGRTLLALGDKVGADSAFVRAMEISRRLLARQPGDPEHQRLLLEVLLARAMVLGASPKVASQILDEADGLAAALSKSVPSVITDLNTLSVIARERGRIEENAGRWIEAVSHYKAVVDFQRKNAANAPDDLNLAERLAIALQLVGAARALSSDLEGAERDYFESVAIAERLAAAEPDNLQWHECLGDSYNYAADIIGRKNQPHTTESQRRELELYGKALAAFQNLAAADPLNAHFLGKLGLTFKIISTVHFLMGDIPAATSAAKEGVVVFKHLLERQPERIDVQQNLVELFHALALWEDERDMAAARRDGEEGMKAARHLVEREHSIENLERQHLMGIVFAGICSRSDAYREAVAATSEAIGALNEILAANPQKIDARQTLFGLHRMAWSYHQELKDDAGAAASRASARDAMAWLKTNDPGYTAWIETLLPSNMPTEQEPVAQRPKPYRSALGLAEIIVELDPANVAGWRTLVQAAAGLVNTPPSGIASDTQALLEKWIVAAERVRALAPDDLIGLRNLAVGHQRIGHHLRSERQPEPARHHLEAAAGHFTTLSEREENPHRAKGDLISVLVTRVLTEIEDGRPDAADAPLQRAQELRAELLQDSPKDFQARWSCAETPFAAARLAASRKSWVSAEKSYREALSAMQEVVAEFGSDASREQAIRLMQTELSEIEKRLR